MFLFLLIHFYDQEDGGSPGVPSKFHPPFNWSNFLLAIREEEIKIRAGDKTRAYNPQTPKFYKKIQIFSKLFLLVKAMGRKPRVPPKVKF